MSANIIMNPIGSLNPAEKYELFCQKSIEGDLEGVKTLFSKNQESIRENINRYNLEGLTLLQGMCYLKKINLPVMEFIVETCHADPSLWTSQKVANCSHLLLSHPYEEREKDSVVAVLEYLHSKGLDVTSPARFVWGQEGLEFAKVDGKF